MSPISQPFVKDIFQLNDLTGYKALDIRFRAT